MKNKKKIRIAVIFGGMSGEHEVSLVSAESVIKNLDKKKYQIIPIGITKQGKWISGKDSLKILKSKNQPTKSNVLIPAEPSSDFKLFLLSKTNSISKKIGIDAVFPVLHGPLGEDGSLQGFLELSGLPYVGCGVLASSVCMDKVAQKIALNGQGINQTEFQWFWKTEWTANSSLIIKRIESNLKYPVFVKPANMGSSVGVQKAGDRFLLKKAIELASKYDRKIIVEKAVSQAREIECSVLGNQAPKASVVGEIIPSNEFYDYDAKYIDGKSKAIIPAKIPKAISKKVQSLAIQAFKILGCEGMARVDFFVTKDNKVFLNEINTIPGFTSISMYPKLWEASGVLYKNLLDELLKLAFLRHKEKIGLKKSYNPKKDWASEA